MGLKKLTLISGLAVAVMVAIFLLSPPKSNEPLRILTWSNYYPDDLLRKFTAKTGTAVELNYISSNEEMLAKFTAGATGYDLIQPSDYAVRQLVNKELLLPLEHRWLSNLHHLDPFYFNLDYDRGLKYAIPFTWGTAGIAVNTKRVVIPPGGVSWSLLTTSPDPKHTSLMDDAREVFGLFLKQRGLSLNNNDPKVLKEVASEIAEVKGRILMFNGEPRALLTKGELTIAHIWSVDGMGASRENPDVKYFIPNEGASLWIDNLSIPRSSEKVQEAHDFIDFFLDPENAARLCQEKYLATPNRTAKELLPESQKNDPVLYPPKEVRDRLEILGDPSSVLFLINRLWTELKTS